jgi:hypothetical protein
MTIATHGKLKLMTLTQRTSSKGNVYMMGILNGLSVIAFPGEPNEWGDTWDIYIQERPQKPQGGAQGHGQQRPSPRSQAAADLFNRPLDRG